MVDTSLSGGDDLERKLAEIATRVSRAGTLRVGFLEGVTDQHSVSVAMIAAINNFGAPEKGIPARPFFTDMIAKNSGKWAEELGQYLELTDFDVEKAFNLMGEHIAKQLVEAIDDTVTPPNSPVTNLLKDRFPMGGYQFSDVQKARSDVAAGKTAPAGKPLIWTGNMRQSVAYEVKTS